jgi:hypothetical protein
MFLPGNPLSTNLVAALTPATPAPTITSFSAIYFKFLTPKYTKNILGIQVVGPQLP